jgi:hypothetical protein
MKARSIGGAFLLLCLVGCFLQLNHLGGKGSRGQAIAAACWRVDSLRLTGFFARAKPKRGE